MTTQPSTVQSAIIWKDKKTPLWDFTETTAYPVVIYGTTVYVHLTPYEAFELKDVLKKTSMSYKRDKKDVEVVPQDDSVYAVLCDQHFEKFSNSTGTPSEQMSFLDKHPELKPGIVQFSFGGVQLDTGESAESNTGILDISAELSGEVTVYQDIYDPVTGSVVRVNMQHKHSAPTEAQYRKYRGARRSKFSNRSTVWAITEQRDVLESLYDSVIQSVSGAAVKGVPCDVPAAAVAKESWVPYVPLWHKLLVCDAIFGELVEKNG